MPTNLANLSPNKFFLSISTKQQQTMANAYCPFSITCVCAWERLIRTQFIVQFNLVWVRATIYGTLTLRYDERWEKIAYSKHCPLSNVSTNAVNDVKKSAYSPLHTAWIPVTGNSYTLRCSQFTKVSRWSRRQKRNHTHNGINDIFRHRVSFSCSFLAVRSLSWQCVSALDPLSIS